MSRQATRRRSSAARRAISVTPLLAVMLLAGCASFGPSADHLSPPAPERQEARQPDVSPAIRREHQRILSAYGGRYDAPAVQAMVSQTVARLVAASERPDVPYQVTLLNSPAVNAFALPGGQLYVTRGLVALANDSAELASVLAHEMAHVIAQHAASRENKARQAALVTRVTNDVLRDPQNGALALAKSRIALASFSRAQEFEADGIGVGIAARAGYDPFGAPRFLTSLGRNASLRNSVQTKPGEQRAPDFVSSHPATLDRVKNAQTIARQFGAPGTGAQDRNAYLASLDGMVYGEDPSEGFVRGRRFLHPKLGFTFVAPEGFVLENTAQAVLGLKDGGREALRLDVVRVSGDQSLIDYLKSGWIENVETRSLEETVINGFPAATATAGGDSWDFRLYAIRFGSDVYRFIFASRNKSFETDRAFREAVGSFRRMSVAEADSAHPLRLRIVTVGADDTAEKLASRMAVSDRATERFLVLNGLEPGAALRSGDRVKIVVE
ncbi:MAG TPA: M48 family metalloprotease [Xanthobacteraceae bacterium]|nr:M48 family metalloprotease [Xanthobacteraceae bacterium]